MAGWEIPDTNDGFHGKIIYEWGIYYEPAHLKGSTVRLTREAADRELLFGDPTAQDGSYSSRNQGVAISIFGIYWTVIKHRRYFFSGYPLDGRSFCEKKQGKV